MKEFKKLRSFESVLNDSDRSYPKTLRNCNYEIYHKDFDNCLTVNKNFINYFGTRVLCELDAELTKGTGDMRKIYKCFTGGDVKFDSLADSWEKATFSVYDIWFEDEEKEFLEKELFEI